MNSIRKKRNALQFEPLEPRQLLAADPIISEFMAANSNTLFDGNGESSDWIEIYNAGDEAIDLVGYSLSDDIGDVTKWEFPSTSLQPDEFLVVFASGDDEPDLDGNLHTNFRLSAESDYVALVDPSGNTVSEFSWGDGEIGPQTSNVSYGLGFNTNQLDVVSPTSASRYLVPSNNQVDSVWTNTNFNDASWNVGTSALGYENSSGYQNLITTELPSGTTTAYVRIPFTLADDSLSLTDLSLQYDDGFVAYLNGTQIASGNAPTSPTFQSVATQNHDDAAAVTFVDFDVRGFNNLLNVGENVLSIRMLNRSSTSSDFLAAVRLTAIAGDINTTGADGPLLSPSPGLPNSQVLAGDVQFSHDGGLFTDSFQVALSTPDDADVIRFTTDGTLPTASSTLYTNPITVSASTRIRARAFGPQGQLGRSHSESYTSANTATRSITSDLPIIVLENFGDGIPPKGPFEDGYLSLFEVDPATGRSSLNDDPTLSTKIGFHRRGSSTAGNPKPNLRVELRDDAGEDQAHSLLGLPSESDWVLYAPYSFDRAMLRDTFFFEASNQLGNYSPRTRFVEVYGNTNGGSLAAGTDYLGVYVLVETIKIDADRVDIAELTPADNTEPEVTGGYILKIDRNDGAPDGNWNSAFNNNYVHFDPERDDLTQPQVDYIRSHIDEFENALYGPNSRDPELGYEAYFNVDASIDYHLIKTLSKDPDALRLSTYLYKDKNGKITFGPQWDFDRAAGPDNDGRASNPVGWDANEAPFFGFRWWGELFDDPDFTQRWIDRWQMHRTNILSDENITAILDGQAAEIREAQDRNFDRWTSVRPNGGQFAEPGLTGWEAEVSHLNGWILTRASWMDTQMVQPPSISPESGNVAAGTQVVLTADRPGDQIYYTLDGSDPRGDNGALSLTARLYSEPFTVDSTLTVTARAQRSNTSALSSWSGPVSGVFASAVPADASNFRITELHYHPDNPTESELDELPLAEDDDFEFVELANVGANSISLVGVQFTDGIDFDFTDSTKTVLAPGERFVLVENAEAFEVRYGDDLEIGGIYSGNLRNSGEQITLTDATGSIILDFEYDDGDPWPEVTDGDGPSLVVVDVTGDFGSEQNWRPSIISGGTPGTLVGDIDGDGTLSCNDVNVVSSAVIINSVDLRFDINGDGIVTAADVSDWVTLLHGTRLGDINFDGTVNAVDFDAWNANRFTSAIGYCNGDFNTDGIIDVSDFNVWNTSRNEQLAQTIANVPTPSILPADSMDINGDGRISPLDALMVINRLNETETQSTAATIDSNLPNYDTNRDGLVSPIDALQIINRLNQDAESTADNDLDTNPLDIVFASLDDDEDKVNALR